jgi:hypothetical protein
MRAIVMALFFMGKNGVVMLHDVAIWGAALQERDNPVRNPPTQHGLDDFRPLKVSGKAGTPLPWV